MRMTELYGDLTWTRPECCDQAWGSTHTRSGVYKWFLQGDLPTDFHWPPSLTPLRAGDLLYIGRAKSLRARTKHHKLGTSKSTLRRALASVMGMQAEWSGNSARPGLIHDDEMKLTSWMSNNLYLSFVEIEPIELVEKVEKSLRLTLKPPLNRDRLTPEQLHTSSMASVMQSNALGRQTSSAYPSSTREENHASPLTSRHTPRANEAITERMALTKRLYEQGLTRASIAGQVGVHASTIGDYIAKLRGKGEIGAGRSKHVIR